MFKAPLTEKLEDIDIRLLQDELNNYLDGDRFIHSLEVAKEAADIARHYENVPVVKARIAGLLHDCSRFLTYEQLLDKSIAHGYIPDKIEEENPKLLHAFVSSVIAHDSYSIRDDEVLSAIRKHTTGDENMSVLDAIVYVADYIDPTRRFSHEVNTEIKKVAYHNIYKAASMVVDQTLNYLQENNMVIHPRTVSFKVSLQTTLASGSAGIR